MLRRQIPGKRILTFKVYLASIQKQHALLSGVLSHLYHALVRASYAHLESPQRLKKVPLALC